MKNPYVVLGISPESDISTIKAAFRKLSKIHHPDCGGSHEKFIEIRTAYGTLIRDKKPTTTNAPKYDDDGILEKVARDMGYKSYDEWVEAVLKSGVSYG